MSSEAKTDPAKVGRYRSHIREVDAIQWLATRESFEAVAAFTGGDPVEWTGGSSVLLRGSNGRDAVAERGDWVLRGDDGRFEVYPRIDFKVMFSPIIEDDPFGPAPTGWRAAPNCARCKDTGRFTEQGVNAHCGCKRGRKMSELWYAEKHGLYHPDEPEPSEPDWGEYDGGGE